MLGRVRRRIFVSYSHDDRSWRDAFRQMLGPALDRFGVELWADDQIRIGDRWERVVDETLTEAELALLLVTPAYLSSSFVWAVEIPTLLGADVPIAWVLLEDCLWDDVAVLREHQALQDLRRDGPLSDHPNRNAELARICRRIIDEHLLTLEKPQGSTGGVQPTSTTRLSMTQIERVRVGPVFGTVPVQPLAFVGRSEELDRLRSLLVEGRVSAVGATARPPRWGYTAGVALARRCWPPS